MPPSTSCPFCTISSLLVPSHTPQNIHGPSGSIYALLSTPAVIAILDIAPVSRGHTLLIPRRHSLTVADMSVAESAAVGIWLGVLSRGVLGGLAGREGEGGARGEGAVEANRGAWNIVQANGAEAGQTVPHVHYHIIPRERTGESVGESDMTDAERKNLVLGEGPRLLLEREDGEEISRLIRGGIKRELDVLLDKNELSLGNLEAEGEEVDGKLWLGSPGQRVRL